jgi:hypothetical protein
MPNTYTLLEQITVGAAGASSVTFNSIPQTGYTDLVVKTSLRNTGTSNDLTLKFNGSSVSQYSDRYLFGNGSTATSGTDATSGAGLYSLINSSNYTASTFGSNEYYIPNYTSANNKSVSYETVQESNATGVYMAMYAGLWANTAAITSMTFAPASGSFAQFSTFSLYGVSALGVTPTRAPKATGGSIIQTDGTYWYHAFLSSGTFTPATALSCDVLVVAGGGGGGNGGGGAGGYRTATGFSVGTSATTVTIGAGGAGATSANNSTNGGDSVFSSITSTGGGKGNLTIAAAAGGSGGGGTSEGAGSADRTGGAGNTPSTSPSQGNNGGTGASTNFTYRGGGGGGGAGAVGGNGAISKGGDGGAGLNTLSSWLSTTGLGVSGYVAGGGGGGSNGLPYSAGGAGGGGAGGDTGNATAGVANTGGGGGGVYGNYPGANAGSGLVIVRYLA